MAIESKNLLVAVKAFARGNALPLDSDEVQESYAAAQVYAASATAYAGQTIKALVDGKYKTYVLQPGESGYTLDEVGAIKSSDLKQYVQMPTEFPSENQEQGVIYIVGSVGKIWNGTEWVTVFEGVTKAEIKDINDALDLKAPLANPAFTGSVTIDGDAAATKSYVDGLIANLNSGAPDVVDSTHPLPTTYKAGMSWRVAEAGTYAGKVCEPGDLIIALVSRTEEGTSTNNDFMIVQANIDGAVTGPATAVDGNIVVFDGVTGKIIKDSSVTIASLNDALAKVSRLDIDVLETYDKNQTTLINEVNKYTDDAIDAAKTEIQGKIDIVDNKFDNYYTSTEIDGKLTPITENLNTKASTIQLSEAVASLQAEIDSDVSASKTEITNEYKDYIQDRIGEGIDENTTIKSYIDTAVGSGGTASAEAIATAKAEAIATAKTYTDNALTVVEF